MLADWIRRNLIWMLLGAYALAAVAPGWGLWLGEIRFAPLAPEAWRPPIDIGGPPMALVAVLLACAAVVVDPQKLRGALARPASLGTALALVWVGPWLVVVIAGLAIPWVAPGANGLGLLLGLTLVAAMPVANSSVGWSQQSAGELAWSVTLIVLSLVVGAWFTPQILKLFGLSLNTSQAGAVEALVREFSGWVFLFWVLTPTLLGMGFRGLVGGRTVARWAPALSIASAGCLLTLNYVNAARVLPRFFDNPDPLLLTVAVVLSLAIAGVGVLMADLAGWCLRLPHPVQQSLRFALSMKHTGLAQALALQASIDQPAAVLLIVVATLTQHIAAAAVSRWK